MLLVLFLALVADGHDSIALSLVVPTIAKEWSVAPTDLALALTAANAGAVIGYVAAGRLVRRWGSRLVVAGSVALFSVGSIATVAADSTPGLTALRFVTGLGFGMVLPAAVSIAAGCVSERRRSSAGVALALAVGVGSSLAGATGGGLLKNLGWHGLFWIPGLVALALTPVLLAVLPADHRAKNTPAASTDPAGEREEPSVRALFAAPLRAGTILVWGFAFLIFLSTYALTAWFPTVLVELGFAPTEAPAGSALIGLGGIVGGLVVVLLAPRFDTPPVLFVTSVVAVITLAIAGLLPLAGGLLLGLAGLAGVGLIAGVTGQTGLALSRYPMKLRTTGVGWAAAVGRIGSILGPLLGGAVLAGGISPRGFIAAVALPAIIAAILALILSGRRTNGAPATPSEGDSGSSRHADETSAASETS
ncbi:MFS transporter [Streptomyces sp. NBC_00078]|uniref:MFS transporter n=1 Tax=unclassified Streptomyces TaxID=2593676 RepID=UPI002254ED1F|nr:MFS transporter [Streptomyces sp. NBC_00078]MCX5426055.1 MFS transporter [Streptomyces sp. NBC_00078]